MGLIGAGMIGTLRARALKSVSALQLVAIADVREERARRIAASVPNLRVESDGIILANDPKLEAIILATPPESHEAIGLACLKAGKHVLCEKPLASTIKGCEALVGAAEQAGTVLATGFNLRYTRAAMMSRHLLDSGAVGELDHIRAFHGHPGGSEFTHDWVTDRAVTGGGTLMDNGIHLIDLTRWFLGDVEDVVGYATNHTWKKAGCEDNGFLLLRNTQGKVAALQASWTEWRGYGYRVEIYGTEGFIRFGYPPMRVVYGRRDDRGKVIIKRHLFPFYQITERIRGWRWGLTETLVHELRGWARAMTSGSPAPTTGHDGLYAVRIAQSARHSFVE